MQKNGFANNLAKAFKKKSEADRLSRQHAKDSRSFVERYNKDDPKVTEAVNDVVYSPLKALGGSVSAEHGIGTHIFGQRPRG